MNFKAKSNLIKQKDLKNNVFKGIFYTSEQSWKIKQNNIKFLIKRLPKGRTIKSVTKINKNWKPKTVKVAKSSSYIGFSILMSTNKINSLIATNFSLFYTMPIRNINNWIFLNMCYKKSQLFSLLKTVIISLEKEVSKGSLNLSGLNLDQLFLDNSFDGFIPDKIKFSNSVKSNMFLSFSSLWTPSIIYALNGNRKDWSNLTIFSLSNVNLFDASFLTFKIWLKFVNEKNGLNFMLTFGSKKFFNLLNDFLINKKSTHLLSNNSRRLKIKSFISGRNFLSFSLFRFYRNKIGNPNNFKALDIKQTIWKNSNQISFFNLLNRRMLKFRKFLWKKRFVWGFNKKTGLAQIFRKKTSIFVKKSKFNPLNLSVKGLLYLLGRIENKIDRLKEGDKQKNFLLVYNLIKQLIFTKTQTVRLKNSVLIKRFKIGKLKKRDWKLFFKKSLSNKVKNFDLNKPKVIILVKKLLEKLNMTKKSRKILKSKWSSYRLRKLKLKGKIEAKSELKNKVKLFKKSKNSLLKNPNKVKSNINNNLKNWLERTLKKKVKNSIKKKVRFNFQLLKRLGGFLVKKSLFNSFKKVKSSAIFDLKEKNKKRTQIKLHKLDQYINNRVSLKELKAKKSIKSTYKNKEYRKFKNKSNQFSFKGKKIGSKKIKYKPLNKIVRLEGSYSQIWKNQKGLSLIYNKRINFFFVNALSYAKYTYNLERSWQKLKPNSATKYLEYTDRAFINKSKYIGIYIKDFIRVGFISMLFKNLTFLLRFIAFLMSVLPRNRKETSFLKYTSKALKKFSAVRKEIEGLRFKYKGRVNKWRRTKYVIENRNHITFNTFNKRILHSSTHAVTRKGSLGVHLWIQYNSSFKFRTRPSYHYYYNNFIRRSFSMYINYSIRRLKLLKHYKPLIRKFY